MNGGDNNCCTVKAIANALDIDFNKAQKALFEAGRKRNHGCNSFTYMRAYRKLAEEKGFALNPMKVTSFDSGKYLYLYNVRTFLERHPTGNYLVSTGSHICNVQGGVIKDGWVWKSLGKRVIEVWIVMPK